MKKASPKQSTEAAANEIALVQGGQRGTIIDTGFSAPPPVPPLP